MLQIAAAIKRFDAVDDDADATHTGLIQQAPSAPEFATVAESGFPGYEANTWNGMLAPAGTPRAIVMRLNQEMLKSLGTREVIDYMTADGAEPAGGTPEQFATCIRTDHAKWAGVIRDAKIIKSN